MTYLLVLGDDMKTIQFLRCPKLKVLLIVMVMKNIYEKTQKIMEMEYVQCGVDIEKLLGNIPPYLYAMDHRGVYVSECVCKQKS